MSRAAIADLDGVIAITRAQLGVEKIAEQVAAKRSDQKRAEAEARDAEGRRSRLVLGLMGVSALRPLIAEESTSLGAADVLREIDLFSGAAAGGGSIEGALKPLVASLDGFAMRAEDAEGATRDEMAVARSAVADDTQALERFKSGGALLGRRTSDLISKLSESGIRADPLCSIVEVVDERWRDAAETLLGNAREALIIKPSDVSEAIRIVDEGGRRFEGCLIYDAKEQDRGSPSAAHDTLASRLHTSSPFARAFLNIRIGNVRCVEQRDELRSHSRAVTPSVLVKSGGAIYKANPPHSRVLGLTAQAGSAEGLSRRIDAAAAAMAVMSVRTARLRRIAAGVADFLTAATAAANLGAVESEMAGALNRAESARNAGDALERTLTSDSFQTLRELEEDRSGHSEDIVEDEKALTTAASAHGQATERLESASARFQVACDRTTSTSVSTTPDIVAEAEALVMKLLNARGSAAAVAKEARDSIDAGGGRIDQRLASVRQEAANYARIHALDFDAGDTFEELAAWMQRRITALEADVLSKYRAEAKTARAEMEKSIYDDFILNLANDLAMGRERVKYLNTALGAHVFNGERFAFTDAEHKDFADVVALSRAVLSSERKISDLFEINPERVEDLSDREARGMARIRAIFEGGGDVDHFTDYRNYLTFDLVSYDAEKDTRIAGSRERSKRSGGERQVPFYIAMASAMASVCFRGRQRGMGFAMFDEAFNALDNGNISASLGMMRQLGLQFLLSAPTEKASAFIPHVDTVINVSRHESYCQIDVEYPMDHAREQMLARDPSISGRSAMG